jgi:hypothetical protein
MPMTISVTFDSSSRPKTMKRMGRIDIGGMTQITEMIGASVARTKGMSPLAMPKKRPMSVAMARPITMRRRLHSVSLHSRISPETLSRSQAKRVIASPKLASDGRSLSLGFSARRSADKVR